jgi:putative aldouronate transport system permease protein
MPGGGFSLFPKVFSTAAYELAFRNPTQIINSYQVTAFFSFVGMGLSIFITSLLAYSLSRSNFKFKNILMFYVFFTMLFNGGLVPSYILNTRYLHLDNSIWIYIIPALVSPFTVIVMRTNFKQIPESLIESAKMDGASELFICFRIVMPLSVPVLATMAFLFFVGKWNDWSTSMLYIRQPRLYSLQFLLQRILRELDYLKQLAREDPMAAMELEMFPSESFRFAMALIASGPVLVIFPFFQKYFSKGLTIGAVKG